MASCRDCLCDSASCRDSRQEAKSHGQSLQEAIYQAQQSWQSLRESLQEAKSHGQSLQEAIYPAQQSRQEARDHGHSGRKPNMTDSLCWKQKLGDSFIPCVSAIGLISTVIIASIFIFQCSNSKSSASF